MAGQPVRPVNLNFFGSNFLMVHGFTSVSRLTGILMCLFFFKKISKNSFCPPSTHLRSNLVSYCGRTACAFTKNPEEPVSFRIHSSYGLWSVTIFNVPWSARRLLARRKKSLEKSRCLISFFFGHGHGKRQ